MKKVFLIAALVLTLVPVTAFAGGVSVLFGAQTVSFGADLGEYYDIPSGAGLTAMVSLDMAIPLDLRVGQRKATEGNSGADATYQWIEVGPRIILGSKEATLRADWFFGVGSYDLKLDDFEFDTAPGGYMGLGLEEIMSEKWLGRLEVKGVYWKSDTFNTDGAALNIALLFGYKF